MRCHRARTAIVDRELGRLDAGTQAELRHHLADCADCGADAALGQRLAHDLSALRGEIPFEVDVTRPVLARIADLQARGVEESSPRLLAWAGAAALITTLALAYGLRESLPDMFRVARDMSAVAASLRGAAVPLITVLAGLLSVGFQLAGAMLESLAGLAPLLHKLRPLVAAGGGLAAATMVTTIVYFVGRDLRGAVPARNH